MRVINRSTVRRFARKHAEARSSLEIWYAVVRAAEWGTSAEVKSTFRRADIVTRERVVLNILGGNYRLVAAIGYRSRRVYIKLLGTHAEYARIDVATVGQF